MKEGEIIQGATVLLGDDCDLPKLQKMVSLYLHDKGCPNTIREMIRGKGLENNTDFNRGLALGIIMFNRLSGVPGPTGFGTWMPGIGYIADDPEETPDNEWMDESQC